MSRSERRFQASLECKSLSLVRRCDLLEIHHSGVYFRPKRESALNMSLMNAIDRKFMDCPFYDVRRMTTFLCEDLGYRVNHKRVARLYKKMGLQTIYPEKDLSKRNKAHPVYPYLLKDLIIDRPNQVWETDITYIPLFLGFMYMVAIIDVYSRRVMNWSISNTMHVE